LLADDDTWQPVVQYNKEDQPKTQQQSSMMINRHPQDNSHQQFGHNERHYTQTTRQYSNQNRQSEKRFARNHAGEMQQPDCNVRGASQYGGACHYIDDSLPLLVLQM